MIKADYDREADAIYVQLQEAAKAFETIEVDERRTVDVDEDGNALGFEVLGAEHYAVDDIAERFGFSELVPAINHEVTVALLTRVHLQEQVIQGGPAGAPPLESGVAEPAHRLRLTLASVAPAGDEFA